MYHCIVGSLPNVAVWNEIMEMYRMKCVLSHQFSQIVFVTTVSLVTVEFNLK